MGAWISKLSGKANPELPGNVVIGNSTKHPGAGFLEALHSPVPIGSPTAGLQNTKPPKYLEDTQFKRRMTLISQFDRNFQRKYYQSEVKAYNQLYTEAVKLLNSKDLKAFDIKQEPQKTRDSYGDNRLGQGCLLARRLIENRVRFVEVDAGGWDNHRDIFTTIPDRARELDQALSALLSDLQGRGLLEQTLVVVATEFGRTPNINQNAGRDHHPGAFTCALAGGGITGGEVFGSSDEDAFSVEEDHVTVADFNATIAFAAGLDVKKQFFSPAGRPFKVAHDGSPLKSLF